MVKQNLVKIFAIISLATMPFTVFADVDPGFNPNKLIEDTVFADTQTFGGPEGIQKFLESKASVLANTSPEFLVRLKEPGMTMLKQSLEDPEPNLPRLRTAAELIWDASKHSGLNPQVILVTLNKEQGLITQKTDVNDPKLQRALDFALGFGCPDSTGCSQSMYPGFYYQLFGNLDSEGNRYLGMAKSLMKSYATPGGRGPAVNGAVAKVGDTVTIENTTGEPYNALPSQLVTITNSATAALYRYTPHVFNGNYNFWRFFNEWFKYPNGTLVKTLGDNVTYIIQNGSRQMVPQFVAIARGLNLSSTVSISPNETANYPIGTMLGPVDNTIVKAASDGKTYVFINNIKHPASNFVISQRGLNPNVAITIDDSELNLFNPGNVLPPSDGTVIRGTVDQTVYLVESGLLKTFSAYTFGQQKIQPKQIVTVADDEIATYGRAGWVAPLDGSLIKAKETGTVYVIDKGLKQPLTGEIFKNRGFSFKNVATLAGEEVSSLPVGAFATPKNMTWFKDGNNQLYLFKEGNTHTVSAYVAKQRGITPDYTFSNEMVLGWQAGLPVAPRDGTVVKGDDATVYLVMNGQLRPLTAAAYKARKITAKKIVTLPQTEVDSYGKGDTLEK